MAVVKLLFLIALVPSVFSDIIPLSQFNPSNGNDYISNNLKSEPEPECSESEQCKINNAECKDGFCVCRDGFIIDGTKTKCLKVANGYYAACEESSQCSEYLGVGARCSNSTCVCSDGYHYLHGKCHKTKGLGDGCSKDDECYAYAEYQAVGCNEKKKCQCKEGFYAREYSACRRLVKDGEHCMLDSDCGPKLQCIGNKCSSKPNNESQVFHQFNIRKVTDNPKKSTVIGSDCEKSDACKSVENSECRHNKCECKAAHFLSENGSFCIPEIGEKCKDDKTFKVFNSECKDQMWTCKYDQVAMKDNQNCEQMKQNINAVCEHRKECQLFGPRADCINKICVCNNQSHWIEHEHFCWLDKKLDEECSHDNDCKPHGTSPQSVCKENKEGRKVCSCPDGSRPETNNLYCISEKPELESYCEKDSDCGKLENIECQDFKCQCKDKFIAPKGVCRAGLFADCKKDEDCDVIKNTECSQIDICECKTNYVASPKDECIPSSKYHEKCEYDAQCTSVTPNTHCSFDITTNETSNIAEIGHCECNHDYYYRNNFCFKNIPLGEACEKEGECYVENSVCKNGVCACNFEYHQEGKICKKNGASALSNTLLSLILPSVILFSLKALR